MLTVTSHNEMLDNATLNTNYFKYNDLFLKGCRNCKKLVDYKHTNYPRFKKENRYVYICQCSECKKPLLLDSIDFYLLIGKV
jgi:hypothetical protein